LSVLLVQKSSILLNSYVQIINLISQQYFARSLWYKLSIFNISSTELCWSLDFGTNCQSYIFNSIFLQQSLLKQMSNYNSLNQRRALI
jgi:hypothetical protein